MLKCIVNVTSTSMQSPAYSQLTSRCNILFTTSMSTKCFCGLVPQFRRVLERYYETKTSVNSQGTPILIAKPSRPLNLIFSMRFRIILPWASAGFNALKELSWNLLRRQPPQLTIYEWASSQPGGWEIVKRPASLARVVERAGICDSNGLPFEHVHQLQPIG